MFTYIETKHGKIALSFEYTNIIIKMSGGLDSSTLLFCLCDYLEKNNLKEHRIIPVTVSKVGNKQKDPMFDKRDLFPVVSNVIDYAKEKYNNVCIETPNFYSIYNWWKKDNSYVKAQDDAVLDIIEKYGCLDDHILYNGITKNPDHDVSRFEPNPERHRQKKVNDCVKNTVSKFFVCDKSLVRELQPFRNSDKRIVFSLADKLGVRENLESIAVSCEGNRRATNNFRKLCTDVALNDEHCWWCLERQWAKENYDR